MHGSARAFALLLVLFAAPSLPARADEPSEIAEKAVPARDAWELCLATQARGSAETREHPAAAADRALERCRRRERSLERVLAGELGAAAAGRILAELRRLQRSSLMDVIEELRAQ
jgi:hypothetical protein